jgi:hypothetical protein
MTNTLTITVNSVPIQAQQGSVSVEKLIDDAKTCKMVINDQSMTASYVKGQRVLVSDTILGKLFSGYIWTANPKRDTDTTFGSWDVYCIDETYLAKKRLNYINYQNRMAGDMVVDMAWRYLQAEGVNIFYATRRETTMADFQQGNLSSVVATANDDGDLELATAGSSVSRTFATQADWATGTPTTFQENANGTNQLVGFTRNWDDGVMTGQTLYGNGSPTQSISSGVYQLSCKKQNETRSRLDFAGLWSGNWTYEVDINIQGDVPRRSVTFGTTNWGDGDGNYAYAVEALSVSIEIRRGANSSSGSTGSSVQLANHNFSPRLAYGWYRLKVVKNGNNYTVFLNNTQYLSVTDSTYTSAAYLALRNRNGEPSVSITDQFDNFGVMVSKTGTWQSPSVSVNSVTTIAQSSVTWDTTGTTGGTILVQSSINGGSTWDNCTNGGAIPGLGPGASGTGKSVIFKVTLSTTSTGVMPMISNLAWTVLGGYAASGTRTTAPLAIDYMDRADQAGPGPASDGQTYTKVGTGTDNIASNELTIANTTGIVFEKLGSGTAADCEGSKRFKLSAAVMASGVVLRYVDVNNWYALVATTTALSFVKCVGGTQAILGTAVISLSTTIWYRIRLRLVGNTNYYGRLWADGLVEPSIWDISGFE